MSDTEADRLALIRKEGGMIDGHWAGPDAQDMDRTVCMECGADTDHEPCPHHQPQRYAETMAMRARRRRPGGGSE